MIPPFLSKVPLIGIMRHVDPDLALLAAEAAARGGFPALEVTMNSAGALDLIAALRSRMPDVAIGAGTVMSIDELDQALADGAQFIVSPHTDVEIVRRCADGGIPVFPGAMTPTEIWQAYSAGASMVKVFPASSLGPEYIKSVRGPLGQIDLLVTGGVDVSNLRSFLHAGARGAAVGGRLFPKDLTASTVDRVERESRALVEVFETGGQ